MYSRLSLTDSYKQSHHRQQPPGMTSDYRGLFTRVHGQTAVFFGLQPILRFIAGPFTNNTQIHDAASLCYSHFGRADVFNAAGWFRLMAKHAGHLPVEIKAVPEGTPVNTPNVLMTIENTDPEFAWLPGWLETMLVQTWYPTAVASQGRYLKSLIAGYLDKTAVNAMANLPYKLHDFGFRGSTSLQSAAIGGGAHLVNFKGTDTMLALDWVRDFYNQPCAGSSVPAAEHGTICPWGRDGEGDAFEHILNEWPEGVVAIVSDSYDTEYACRVLWGSRLKKRVLERHGTVVVRPDSGHPVDNVLMVLNTLGDAFGTTTNIKGYKELPPTLRVIQGDGMNRFTIAELLEAVVADGWCTDMLTFGMGSALIQEHTRDDLGVALKCTEVVVDGEVRPVFKSPIGDPLKATAGGRRALVRLENGTYMTVAAGSIPGRTKDELRVVFRNGELINPTSFADVRQRAMIELERTAEPAAQGATQAEV